MARKNPYSALKDEFRKFVGCVKYRRRVRMWVYPKNKLGEGWSLADLAERVAAADQLNHDVVLTNDSGDLVVSYVERVTIPWQFS